MAQGVSQTWNALAAALTTMFNGQGQLVCQGEPGEYQPDLIVSMTAMREPITQPTAGTNRSRDKRIDIDLVISAYVAGGAEAHPPAIQAAFDACDLIESYFRTGDNARLGGACYNAFLDFASLEPFTQWHQDDGFDAVPIGRIAQITATVKAWIRI